MENRTLKLAFLRFKLKIATLKVFFFKIKVRNSYIKVGNFNFKVDFFNKVRNSNIKLEYQKIQNVALICFRKNHIDNYNSYKVQHNMQTHTYTYKIENTWQSQKTVHHSQNHKVKEDHG